MLTSMFSGLGSNDLKSFKEYIESDESKIKDYAKAVEYRFNVVPKIYSFNGEKVRKVNQIHLFRSWYRFFYKFK